MRVDGKYTKLNTEVYGGMQLALWTDRPLSVAGAAGCAHREGREVRPLRHPPGFAAHPRGCYPHEPGASTRA